MMSYRMEDRPREAVAAEDPFGGRGIFFAFPGTSAEILEELELRLGKTVPCFAWEGIGAWADPESAGMPADLAARAWSGGMRGNG